MNKSMKINLKSKSTSSNQNPNDFFTEQNSAEIDSGSIALMPDNQRKEYEFEWGAFALIEFLVSCQSLIGKKYKTALDIGSGLGVQTEIMRHAGLNVFQVDKYSETADFQVDFIDHEFKQKFDIIYSNFCTQTSR